MFLIACQFETWRSAETNRTKYAYDAAGNRTSKTNAAGTTSYSYETGTDRLASASGAEAAYFAHDAYGNRIYEGSSAYTGTPTHTYNDQNRLVSVAITGGTVDSVYDAFGRRIDGHGMVFVYDQAGRVLEALLQEGSSSFFGDLVWVEGELLGRVEDDVSVGIDLSAWVPPAVHRWMPGPGQRWIVLLGAGGTLLLFSLAVRTRSPRWGTAGAALALVLVAGIACVPTGVAFYWVVTDHLGTPIAMTNTPTSGEAKVIWKASYEPFGRAVEDLDPDSDSTSVRMPVRFPGQWWDYNTKDHSNGFRTYDPKTGRYLEADPIGQAGGLNLYVYVDGDPVNWFDPFGLEEGSPSNLAKRAAISRIARRYLGSDLWAKSKRRDAFRPGQWKCNKFVCDVTAEASAPILVEAEGNLRCPRAGETANRNATTEQWRVLKPTETPEPGDVAAYPIPGGGAAFSGHTGIVTDQGIIAAREHLVDLPSPGQFESSDTVFRRFIGD